MPLGTTQLSQRKGADYQFYVILSNIVLVSLLLFEMRACGRGHRGFACVHRITLARSWFCLLIYFSTSRCSHEYALTLK